MYRMSSRAPLDMLMNPERTSPEEVQGFMDSSCVMRDLVESSDATHLLLPLRGAMPMAWAMEGVDGLEPNPTRRIQRLEIPLGTFLHLDQHGKLRPNSPNRPQKAHMISSRLQRSRVDEGSHLVVLDEVQGGGTIIPVIRTIMNARNEGMGIGRVSLFAAQDSRVRGGNRRTTGQYRKMVAQRVGDLTTTVVNTPLICMDRDMLLDSVQYTREYDPNMPTDYKDFSIYRNVEAESLLRFLGSLARNPDLAHDEAVLDAFAESQTQASDQALTLAPLWLASVAHRQHGRM